MLFLLLYIHCVFNCHTHHNIDEGIEYSIDFSGTDTIILKNAIKIPFIREYYHRSPKESKQQLNEQLLNKQHKVEDTQDRKALQLLNLQGRKGFGISVGQGNGPVFDQSTELTLNSNFDDFKVDGVLKDDNMPIQPEGNTQELKAIDEIYINITKGENRLRLGDFNMQLNESSFGRISRELEGVSGKLDTTTFLKGGISKGRWNKKEFEGLLGKQGPYRLSCYAIVAGSENVMLNGKKKQRGKHYVIDYADACITFTNSIMVETGDKILVTFQEMKDEYKTFIVSGGRKMHGFNLAVFREEDMKGSISKNQFEELKHVNNDSNYAWISGAVFKGNGKGSYIKKDSIYEYVGFNKGNYEVSFTKVTNGDYEFDGIIAGYKYVGTAQGEYIPMLRIALPQKNVFAQLGYAKELNGFEFEIEGVTTRFEPNSVKNNIVTGNAFRGAIETKKEHWNAGINIKQKDSTFHFPGESDTTEYMYQEVFYTLSPITFLEMESKGVRTDNNVGAQLGIKFTPPSFPNVLYKRWTSKREIIDEFTLSHNIFGVIPFYNYKNIEEKIAKTKIPRKEELVEVGIQNTLFTASTAEKRRKGISTLCIQDEISLINKISVTQKPIDLSYSNVQKISNDEKLNMELGDFKFNLYGVSMNYNLTSIEQGKMREEFYEVARGKGSFSKDSTGAFYDDPHGNYEKKTVPADSLGISKRFNFINTLSFEPIPQISVKIGAIKRGDGEKIRLWERTNTAYDDRNQLNAGIMIIPHNNEYKVNNIYVRYGKNDYRQNKIDGIQESGNENVWDGTIMLEKLDLKYRTRVSKKYTYSTHNNRALRTAWDEKANTAGVNTAHKLLTPLGLKNITLRMLVEGEKREISISHGEKYNFYGYAGTPGLEYNAGNQMMSCGIKATHWLTKECFPLNIKAIYPGGTTLDWDINWTIFSKGWNAIGNTEYIIGYRGNKTPNYPVDHSLNAQLQLHF